MDGEESPSSNSDIQLEASEELGVLVDEDESNQHGLRELGHLAVWSVTSAKPGNGVELLRDDREDTYWQSDGTQPHLINVQFQKKVKIQRVALFLDYRMDESYTPNRIAIKVGTSFHDLKEVRVVELEEPKGWVSVPLLESGSCQFLRAFMVQIVILANHQNGRDTHIRKIKIFGPQHDTSRVVGQSTGFSSKQLQMHACVR